jgi:hypothetical protein
VSNAGLVPVMALAGRAGLGDLAAVPARTARHGRGNLTLHLPQGWHREGEWLRLWHHACGPARHRGLTSPDPVTHPARPKATPETPPPTGTCGQAAENASGRKTTPKNSPPARTQPPTARDPGRWIQA